MIIPDLIRQAVQARGSRGRRYRIRRVSRPTYPTALAVVYAGRLERPVSDLVQLVEKHVIANAGGIAAAAAVTRQHDEYGQTLDDIIKYIGQEFANKWPPEQIERLARDQAIRLSETNRQQLTRILSNALGVPIFFRDGWTAPEINAWTKTNAGLITSLKDQHINDVRSLVTGSIRSGRTVQDVTREIQEKYARELADKPRNRAELIARDQVGKFYGNSNQLRQRELGVERYVWRGVLDQRERDSHRAKEGKIFRWDQPPSDTGHPGEDYQCRCTAEPYLADVVPTDIPSREDLMRDIAKQQEAARSRERIIVRPAPEPSPSPARQTREESPEEISARIFGAPEIEGGGKAKRETVTKAIQDIAQQLGENSPKTLLPPIVLKRTTRYNGAVLRSQFKGEIIRLEINTAGDTHQAFSLAHEIGHIVDARDAIRSGFPTSWMSGLTDEKTNRLLLKVMNAISESPELKWIKEKKGVDGQALPISTNFQHYLLSNQESFARAFAQYMAIETKSQAMREGLDEIRSRRIFYQWSDKNFQPIREAMNEYLGKRK